MSNESTISEGPLPPSPPPNTEITAASDSNPPGHHTSGKTNLAKYHKQGPWPPPDMSRAVKTERIGSHLSTLARKQPVIFPRHLPSPPSSVRFKLPEPPLSVYGGSSGYTPSIRSLPRAPPNSLVAGSVGYNAPEVRSDVLVLLPSHALGEEGVTSESSDTPTASHPTRTLPLRQKSLPTAEWAPSTEGAEAGEAAGDGVFEHSDWREEAISSMQNAVRQVVRLAVDDYQKEPSKTPVQYYNECVDRVFRDRTLFQAFVDIGFGGPVEMEGAGEKVEDRVVENGVGV